MTGLADVRAHLAAHPDGTRGDCCRELLVELAEKVLAESEDPVTLKALARAGWCECCLRPTALPDAAKCFSCLGHHPAVCPWRGDAA